MKVLVTGGTGFVGCHSVAALVSQGHQVRLLVRSPDQVARSLSPLGVTDVESVVGDVTASQSVDEAMAGCDAVLHAAAVYTTDPRAASRIQATNVRRRDRPGRGGPHGPRPHRARLQLHSASAA